MLENEYQVEERFCTFIADIRSRNFVKGWAAVLVAAGCAGTGDPAPQVIFSEVIQDHKANRGLAPHTATL